MESPYLHCPIVHEVRWCTPGHESCVYPWNKICSSVRVQETQFNHRTSTLFGKEPRHQGDYSFVYVTGHDGRGRAWNCRVSVLASDSVLYQNILVLIPDLLSLLHVKITCFHDYTPMSSKNSNLFEIVLSFWISEKAKSKLLTCFTSCWHALLIYTSYSHWKWAKSNLLTCFTSYWHVLLIYTSCSRWKWVKSKLLTCFTNCWHVLLIYTSCLRWKWAKSNLLTCFTSCWHVLLIYTSCSRWKWAQSTLSCRCSSGCTATSIVQCGSWHPFLSNFRLFVV
jgi:hypothetical protein